MAKRGKKKFEKLKALAKKTKARQPRKRRRRFRSNPGPEREMRSNPPLMSDLAEYAIPGLGGFVATKFIANLASSQIAKRWPQYAKHAGALASIGSFLSSWWLGHRMPWLARWHSPITVGSAIASAHNLMQLYFPDKLAWIVGSPKTAAVQAVVAQQQIAAAQQAAQQQAEPVLALPDHLEEVDDDPSWYTFNDAYDAGRMPAPAAVVKATAQIDNTPLPQDAQDEDLATGLFADNHFNGYAGN